MVNFVLRVFYHNEKKIPRNVVRDDSFYKLRILFSLLQPRPPSTGSLLGGRAGGHGHGTGMGEVGGLRLGAGTDPLQKAVCPFVGRGGGRQCWKGKAGWVYSHLTWVWDAHGVKQGLVTM